MAHGTNSCHYVTWYHCMSYYGMTVYNNQKCAHVHISSRKMQDELPYFASSLIKTITVNSKMAPIQVVHNICIIALKNPGVTLLSCCSVHAYVD